MLPKKIPLFSMNDEHWTEYLINHNFVLLLLILYSAIAVEVRSVSDQSGYPVIHPPKRWITDWSDYPSDWTDYPMAIRSIRWMFFHEFNVVEPSPTLNSWKQHRGIFSNVEFVKTTLGKDVSNILLTFQIFLFTHNLPSKGRSERKLTSRKIPTKKKDHFGHF